jgi:hypothetical protein
MCLAMNIPCGCEQRKEIMGAGEWKTDAVLVGGLILAVVLIYTLKGDIF